MRFKILTIFPEFFDVLGLSLLGKAAENGVLTWDVTNLRDFTDDPHHSVDDTPYGGGAGMVMRADIWGKAIDAALADLQPSSAGETTKTQVESGTRAKGLLTPKKTVLAIPTPSGTPLTQGKVREIAANVEGIIFACGRYEGIDARVAQHYADAAKYPDLEVFEYSLGDYVLNGGEVAAVALIEAVGRLLDGTVGNPESLVEESYEGTGLLEYPSFTRPETWRDLTVPEVLKGGNHAEIEAWRNERAIEKTVTRRPDLLPTLQASLLSKREKEMLAGLGWLYVTRKQLAEIGLDNLDVAGEPSEEFIGEPVRIRRPDRAEALALSALGSETFPLACPAYVSAEAIARFVATEFDADAVKARLEDPAQHRYWVAEMGGELVGYTYAKVALSEAEAQAAGVTPGDAYLSKCYVREVLHSTGLSGALLKVSLEDLAQCGAAGVSLGTSIYNKRAQKFYKRHGFKKVGTRKFVVGGTENQDVVMRRDLGEFLHPELDDQDRNKYQHCPAD